MMRTKLRFMSFVLGAGMLASCASIVDHPNQDVQFMTPGAVNAKCNVVAKDASYTVNPPETLFMRRSVEPLTVTCMAPGNREKTIIVYAKLNKTAVGNVATAGAGAVYDHVSGAMYEYPNLIEIDFRNTIAEGEPLPKYHAPDTVSPFDQIPENMDAGTPQVQGDKPLPNAATIDAPY